jgi:hypothetical protein
LNSMDSRSISISSPPYKISSKSTNRFKTYYGVSLHPRQIFKRPQFWNGWSQEKKKCGVEITFNDIICLPNPLIASKVINVGHTDTYTHTQAGYLINLLSFLESRLINSVKHCFTSCW